MRTLAGHLLLLVWLLLDARSAAARAATPPPPPPPGFPLVTSEQPLVVEGGRVHVRCGAIDFIGVIASCRVAASLRVRVAHDDRLIVQGANVQTSGSNFEVLVGFDVDEKMAQFNRDGKRFRVNTAVQAAAAPATTPTP